MASGGGIRLGTVMGAPVLLMPSWFVIAALITFFYAPVVRTRLPTDGPATFVVAFVAALLLLGSVFLHELSHAVVARAVGTPPAHIVLDVWGGHTSFDTEMKRPGHSALVSLVGPATNGVIALAAALLHQAMPAGGVAELLLVALAYANGFVAVFNALPGLPLDGGRALEALIWQLTGDRAKGTLAAAWVGRAVAAGLVVYFVLGPWLTGRPPGLTTTIWVMLVAAMLWQGATAAMAQGRLRRRMPGLSVAALRRAAIAVDTSAALGEALRRADQVGVRDLVLVDPTGRPVAVLDHAALAAVPPERLDLTRTSAVARALPPDAVIPHTLAGEALLARVRAANHPELAVVDDDGAVVGLLRRDDVAAAVTGRPGPPPAGRPA